MSASGVDKSDLRAIGEHILLVHGYDPAEDVMMPERSTRRTAERVSVDAIEHWMIYREHPEVGAILHVHGVDRRHHHRPRSTTRAAPRTRRPQSPTSYAPRRTRRTQSSA